MHHNAYLFSLNWLHYKPTCVFFPLPFLFTTKSLKTKHRLLPFYYKFYSSTCVMSTSESCSSTSITAGSSTFQSTLSANLPYIKGYRFKNTIPSSAHSENVEIISGYRYDFIERVDSRLYFGIKMITLYRISNKSSVVGKVSSSSLQLEREFYIMKKLYQYIDGSLHLGNHATK